MAPQERGARKQEGKCLENWWVEVGLSMERSLKIKWNPTSAERDDETLEKKKKEKKCPMASIERNKYLQNHLKTAKYFLGVEESPPAAVWFPPKLLQIGHRQRKPAEAWSLIMIPKCGQGMKQD